MIKVIVQKEDDYYRRVSISGHAMYDDFGKDIVCSAVSSIVTTTINGILRLDNNSINYQHDNDLVDIVINSNDKTIQVLILNMVSLLQELEQDYPKNIQVK